MEVTPECPSRATGAPKVPPVIPTKREEGCQCLGWGRSCSCGRPWSVGGEWRETGRVLPVPCSAHSSCRVVATRWPKVWFSRLWGGAEADGAALSWSGWALRRIRCPAHRLWPGGQSRWEKPGDRSHPPAWGSSQASALTGSHVILTEVAGAEGGS